MRIGDKDHRTQRSMTCRWLSIGMAVGVLAIFSGCASMFGPTRTGVSSSVVDFLYPAGQAFEPMDAGIPTVRLPARVGLMFVPSRSQPVGISAADQQTLLQRVRDAFSEHDFIERIDIIPQNYLRPGGGFENLEQVARMHGVEIVALVSYDQMLRTEESAASFLYWTIVGAYTIPANRNQVSTFVETAVFDVASRTLLLRAPGQNQMQASSTAIRVEGVQQRIAGESFRAAMEQMVGHLDQSIVEFDQRVRDEGQVRLVQRDSGENWHQRSRGKGSLWPWELLALLGVSLLGWLRRR